MYIHTYRKQEQLLRVLSCVQNCTIQSENYTDLESLVKKRDNIGLS